MDKLVLDMWKVFTGNMNTESLHLLVCSRVGHFRAVQTGQTTQGRGAGRLGEQQTGKDVQ